MLESIRTLVDVPSQNDVFLTRSDIAATRHRRLLLLQARDRAKEEVREALKEADQIRTHAFKEGYSEGVVLAASDIGAALTQSRTLVASLREELIRMVKQLLGELLMHEQMLDVLLERWLAEQQVEQESPLQIVLPIACKSRHLAIREKLSTYGYPAASISYHDQSRYLFRLADQVVELNVDSTQERLAPQILARLESLPESIRRLEYASANVLVRLVENIIDVMPPDQLSEPLGKL